MSYIQYELKRLKLCINDDDIYWFDVFGYKLNELDELDELSLMIYCYNNKICDDFYDSYAWYFY